MPNSFQPGAPAYRQAILQFGAGAVGQVDPLRYEWTPPIIAALPAERVRFRTTVVSHRATLGRLAPAEQRMRQSARTEDDERHRHREGQPHRKWIPSGQHGCMRIGRIVPARVNIVPLGRIYFEPVERLLRVLPIIERRGGDVRADRGYDIAGRIFDFELGPERGAVLGLRLFNAGFQNLAARFDELLVHSPAGRELAEKHLSENRAAGQQENG